MFIVIPADEPTPSLRAVRLNDARAVLCHQHTCVGTRETLTDINYRDLRKAHHPISSLVSVSAFPAASICYMPLKGLKVIAAKLLVESAKNGPEFFSRACRIPDEVRTFIEENLPADIRDKGYRGLKIEKEDVARWHRTLYEKGWAAPAWPKEHGGCEWDAVRLYIFNEELSRAHAPALSPFGLTMVGPVIYTFGSQAQKERYLPKILSGEEFWCQGYSSFRIGLASLQTKAIPTETITS